MLDCYYDNCPVNSRSRTRRVRWWSEELKEVTLEDCGKEGETE